MFGASSFVGDLASWNVSNVVNFATMFVGLKEWDGNLCSWGQQLVATERIVATVNMFLGTGCVNTSDPDPMDLGRGPWCGICDASATDSASSSIFGTGVPLLPLATTEELYTAVDKYLFDVSASSVVALTYGYPIGVWNVSMITDFSGVFDSERNPATRNFNEALDGWDLSNAESISSMFRGTLRFEGAGLESWRMPRCINMSFAFDGAEKFNGDIAAWATDSVLDMTAMVSTCRNVSVNLGTTHAVG
jgi:Mycoplasma protein of unknown function, DUF285